MSTQTQTGRHEVGFEGFVPVLGPPAAGLGDEVAFSGVGTVVRTATREPIGGWDQRTSTTSVRVTALAGIAVGELPAVPVAPVRRRLRVDWTALILGIVLGVALVVAALVIAGPAAARPHHPHHHRGDPIVIRPVCSVLTGRCAL